MSELAPAQTPLPGTRCAQHPERTAEAICACCGDFACGECHRPLGPEHVCTGCLDRSSPLADPFSRLAATLIDASSTTVPFAAIACGLAVRDGGVAAACAGSGATAMIALGFWQLRGVRRTGQSLGKRLLRLRVVRADGRRMGLGRIVFLRNLLPALIGAIPIAGGLFSLVDAMFVFGSARRTLHDRLADSIVVSVRAPANGVAT